MTLQEAKTEYRKAEKYVLSESPHLKHKFIQRATAIDDRLVNVWGETRADIIIDLVFDNEIFCKCPHCGEKLREQEADSVCDCGCPSCRKCFDVEDCEILNE